MGGWVGESVGSLSNHSFMQSTGEGEEEEKEKVLERVGLLQMPFGQEGVKIKLEFGGGGGGGGGLLRGWSFE